MPPQDPGTHTVTVTAIDEAGNTTSTSTEFTIEGIEPPVITYYPKEIEPGDLVKIRGTTYSNAEVYIRLRENDEVISEEYTKSNSLGDFVLAVSKQLNAGTYTFTAYVIDGRGAKSKETDPFSIKVTSRFLVDLTALVLDYLAAFILGLLALAGIIGVSLFFWHRFYRIIHRIRQGTHEVGKIVDTSFTILRRDVITHLSELKAIKRKKLRTKEEITFLENFEDDLTKAEEIIGRKLRDDLPK